MNDAADGVGMAERVCSGVQGLIKKVQSTLERMHDLIVPDSMSGTIAGMVDRLALKEGGEDPMDVAM
jgi:hypothetical protein